MNPHETRFLTSNFLSLSSKIETLLKMEILVKNQNFAEKWKFWSKIKTLLKNGNFGQKSKLF